MKVAQFLGNCFFLSGIFFRQFQALPPGCPAYPVPYATNSLIVYTIWVGRFRFDCTVSLTVVCNQRKEIAVMVFILSKIKCFFRLLQSAALQPVPYGEAEALQSLALERDPGDRLVILRASLVNRYLSFFHAIPPRLCFGIRPWILSTASCHPMYRIPSPGKGCPRNKTRQRNPGLFTVTSGYHSHACFFSHPHCFVPRMAFSANAKNPQTLMFTGFP